MEYRAEFWQPARQFEAWIFESDLGGQICHHYSEGGPDASNAYVSYSRDPKSKQPVSISQRLRHKPWLQRLFLIWSHISQMICFYFTESGADFFEVA
jgi:hypothetical protein